MSRNKKKNTIDKIEEGKEIEKEVSLEEKISKITEETLPTALNTVELNQLIGEPMEKNTTEKKQTNDNIQNKGKKPSSRNNHFFVHTFLILVLIICLIYFGFSITDNNSTLFSIVHDLLITVFTILFVSISITYNRSKKGMIFLSSLLLIGYFIIGINGHSNLVKTPSSSTPDFRGKSLTSVIKWADKNHVSINQEYEYSDMVPEYKIISQTTNESKKKNITDLTVSISEGPNPSKEIMIPSMLTWDDERVIKFVLDNHLSNVVVEFVESDKAKDTVIEQSTSGNIKRDEELKLTFSYGEELGYDEVKLIDFTNKSKFEVEFYLKQHQLRYEFEDDFDSKIKKGYVTKQSIASGEVVHVDDERIKITLSKGPKIKIPDFKDMSLEEITEWAIKHKLKLKYSDQYDDSIKENGFISANYSKGDIVEQGTVLKIVLSRGSLKMRKFDSLNDFYDWANKYNISYEEKHEFSDSVEAGEVISYSYKSGDSIKNGDTITVVISDGKKQEVPNLKGLTKSEAKNKLEKVGLKYSFIYKNSNDVSKDKVISQSIRAGSEVSNGVTVTVTLSNGKKEDNKSTTEKRKTTEEKKEEKNEEKKEESVKTPTPTKQPEKTSPTPTPTPTPVPEKTCDKVDVYIDGSHIKNTPSATCSTIKSAYSSLKFTCSYVCGPTNGLLLNSSSIDEHTFTTCDTISLKIADSDKC